jgi:DUF4097 and DUF4098 domain-containing protein YvlB
MRPPTFCIAGVAAIAWLTAGAAGAQQAGNPNDPWCQRDGDGNRGHYCEVREFTLPAPGSGLTVNARPNGSIKIVGSDRRDMQVRARVAANADTSDQAQALVRQVTVQTSGSIHAEGPSNEGERNWSVSYEISVPTDQMLSLSSTNGSIAISTVRGQAEFTTQNGSISLTDVSGNFKGRTQNGSVQLSLQGTRWDGEGLDLETGNGSIRVTVPDGFAAHVETHTVNGRVTIDFPVTIAGEVDRRNVTTDLNGGGASMRLVTTNGSVSIRKR